MNIKLSSYSVEEMNLPLHDRDIRFGKRLLNRLILER